VSKLEQPVARMLDAYTAAVRAKDVDGLVALYARDVCVFDMWGRWTYEGVNAWRSMVEEWFASLGTEEVAVTFEEVRTLVNDDVAVAHALVTYTGLSAAGEELRAMDNRLTWALRRTDGPGWRIVHEHTSAPIGFEDSKPILRR